MHATFLKLEENGMKLVRLLSRVNCKCTLKG